MNQSAHLSTIRWDRDLLKTKILRRGTNKRTVQKVFYHYKDLYDDVHPNKHLAFKWYTYMCIAIAKNLITETHSNEINELPSDGENEF